MKKITLMVAIVCCNLMSWAQTSHKLKHPQLYKVLPESLENTPKWVTLLYSDHPNIDTLEEEFVKYYSSHPFSKSIHTSNYKYFMRKVRNHDLLDENRNVYVPSLDQQEERTENLKKTRGVDSKTAGAWSAVGPMRTLHLNRECTEVGSSQYLHTRSVTKQSEYRICRSRNLGGCINQ